jgi:hypothetical protein
MGQAVHERLFLRIKGLPRRNPSHVGARLKAAWRGKDSWLISQALALSVGVTCASLTTVAEAADRPARQAAPIEYAKICDAAGAAFFFTPGSDRCLQTGGLAPGMMRDQSLLHSLAGPPLYLNNILDVTDGRGRFSAAGIVLLPDPLGFGASAGSPGASFRNKPARISEIIGNLRLEQPSGSANVPGIGHSQQATLATIAPFLSTPGFTPPYAFPTLTGSSYGFAMQGGVQSNLDYLSPGDKLWLQAAYEKAPSSYVADNIYGSAGQNFTLGSKSRPDPHGAGWNPHINFNCIFADSSKCDQQSSWDITGAYKNYWLPILNSTPFGSTLEVRNRAEASSDSAGTAKSANLKEAVIEPSLFRSPLRGFDIGAEYMYAHVSQSRPADPAMENDATAGGLPAFGPSTGLYEGRLRVQRGY